MRSRLASAENAHVNQRPDLYSIRISGQLGPMALSAFPSMVSQVKDQDTVLTGILDRSALYGVLAEIEFACAGPGRASALGSSAKVM
jgi:hypothetical protein